MTPLIRRTLIIVLGLFTIMSAVRLVGNGTEPNRQLEFNPLNCHLPCLLGITPGKTTYAQAGQIVDTLSTEIHSDAWGLYFSDSQGAEVHIQLGDSSTKRDFVTLLRISACCDASDSLTTLGDLISLGYVPVRVFRVRYAGPDTVISYIVFDSQPTLVAGVVGSTRLTPSSPVVDLMEDSVSHSPDDLLSYYGTHTDDEIEWHGFVPVDRYLRAPAIK